MIGRVLDKLEASVSAMASSSTPDGAAIDDGDVETNRGDDLSRTTATTVIMNMPMNMNTQPRSK